MDARAIQREITVEYDGRPCRVTYRPFARPDVKEALDEAGPEGRIEAVLGVLADVIVTWDVKDADGRPYATTAEALAELPLPFIRDLWQTMSAEASRLSNQLEARSNRRKEVGRRSRRRKGA